MTAVLPSHCLLHQQQVQGLPRPESIEGEEERPRGERARRKACAQISRYTFW